jgi:hypothetical protein
VERVICKNKKRLQTFRMKAKWKSKNLKPPTVDGKIILNWISNIRIVRGWLRIRKKFGEFFAKQ